MNDDGPSHYARVVRKWLEDNFPGRWTDRQGPALWPPRSPDLTPCDFFSLGLGSGRSI